MVRCTSCIYQPKNIWNKSNRKYCRFKLGDDQKLRTVAKHSTCSLGRIRKYALPFLPELPKNKWYQAQNLSNKNRFDITPNLWKISASFKYPRAYTSPSRLAIEAWVAVLNILAGVCVNAGSFQENTKTVAHCSGTQRYPNLTVALVNQVSNTFRFVPRFQRIEPAHSWEARRLWWCVYYPGLIWLKTILTLKLARSYD